MSVQLLNGRIGSQEVEIVIKKTIREARKFVFWTIPEHVEYVRWGTYCTGCLARIRDERPPKQDEICQCPRCLPSAHSITIDVSNFDVGNDWPPRKRDVDESVIVDYIRKRFTADGYDLLHPDGIY